MPSALKPNLIISIFCIIVIILGTISKDPFTCNWIKSNISIVLVSLLTTLKCYFFDIFVSFWHKYQPFSVIMKENNHLVIRISKLSRRRVEILS